MRPSGSPLIEAVRGVTGGAQEIRGLLTSPRRIRAAALLLRGKRVADQEARHGVFAEAVRVDPSYARARTFLGYAAVQRGDPRTGLAAFERARRAAELIALFESLTNPLVRRGRRIGAPASLPLGDMLLPSRRVFDDVTGPVYR